MNPPGFIGLGGLVPLAHSVAGAIVGAALPAAVMRNFDRAIAAGHGDKEMSAVFETLIAGEGG